MPTIPPSEQSRPMTIEELAEITGHTPEEIAGKMADGTLCHMSSVEAEAMSYRLIAQAPAMYELLKEIQFEGYHGDPTDASTEECPICHQHKWDGHEPDCRLGNVLNAVEEAQ
jgi:hypothetical protein